MYAEQRDADHALRHCSTGVRACQRSKDVTLMSKSLYCTDEVKDVHHNVELFPRVREERAPGPDRHAQVLRGGMGWVRVWEWVWAGTWVYWYGYGYGWVWVGVGIGLTWAWVCGMWYGCGTGEESRYVDRVTTTGLMIG